MDADHADQATAGRDGPMAIVTLSCSGCRHSAPVGASGLLHRCQHETPAATQILALSAPTPAACPLQPGLVVAVPADELRTVERHNRYFEGFDDAMSGIIEAARALGQDLPADDDDTGGDAAAQPSTPAKE